MPDGWPFDCKFDRYSDPELLRVVEKELSHLDRGDMVNLVEELARRLKEYDEYGKIRRC